MVILYLLLYRYLPPYTPIKTAQLISRLDIPCGVQVEKHEYHFAANGDGYTEIIIALNSEKFDLFVKNNEWGKYNNLPIKEERLFLPNEYHHFYVSDKGYYRIIGEGRSYEIVIIDSDNKRIFIYASYN